MRAYGLPKDAANLRMLKAAGFSDARLGALCGLSEAQVAEQRAALGVPVYKRIDTCAAEFASPTAYMYSTYEAPFGGAKPVCEAGPSSGKRSSSSAADRTASGRASSSTIAAATPRSRCATPATRRS